ncbi:MULTISPECIES: tRNA (N(6)-L-threonylcarbamoyladenosine(37)-C(2))-methylthiotransferase MtaB [Clostridium]|uniref:Threonylcarbamoyladenosine tRNA methylthiotransferase MtaB n=2 Tax=Clostridium TaxID=1485 RepID=A0A151ALQ3_9CLOT|nr:MULTISPECIES: tRNA (N(6)-L-threonylcarbamoyladenosine(37)-C(2))-methylthiotransferase MtaB [Clostridium]KYH28575.1 threonylcarbamoyladenosine tRNA methylthiotransferase MtaB [Clostridium colicanis DSM 13634]MBE6042867.1 tRNA (N(6)-L-threonylcarbamoyladenosine(37)-C(2))-methylthiotransferase MtaB [Clostridium thermopalmarium]PRR74137.1 Threonylcarbamoyladenosine tRNA methylthiotransferase MtaB [Clostridium thermopalmarium DSM 5974]PVZ25465.1 threonylcarbamoyladenosine tRNA methylthiotransfera
MKVAFATLGCRVNQYESEAMAEKFIKNGYEVVPFEDVADVYVINTCTVTNMSDKKSRQMISRAKRKNKDAIIAAVGCYTQIAPDKVSELGDVDVILGTRNKGEIVYWVNRAKEEKKQIVAVNDVLRNKVFEDLRIEDYQDKTRAFLKIQDGCNNFCSYCLIPFARGAVCSKDPETVIYEVRELAKHGFKEVILSGIDISSYGVDLEEDYNLLKILQEIEKIEGINRIRIGSIGPEFFNEEIIKEIGKLKKLCPHFHLSLQSGCDETLRRMNRKYNIEHYRNIVNLLREYVKDVSITTDIIVGFPGETEEEFKKTYDFLKEIKLSKMHIFKYSPRSGTRAERMENQVDGNIKEERSKMLLDLNKKNEKEFMDKFIGRDMEVLYEQMYNENSYEGYTPNYIKVISQSKEPLQGKILRTRLKSIKEDYIIGEIISK